MSKRKIKNNFSKKRHSAIISISKAEVANAAMKNIRMLRRREEDEIVANLIDNEMFEMSLKDDYSYMLKVSKGTGMSMHVFMEAIKRWKPTGEEKQNVQEEQS